MRETLRLWLEGTETYVHEVILEQRQGKMASVVRGFLHIMSKVYGRIIKARRFLYNIIQYPGCGTFFKPASFVAFERDSGQMCGLSLASLVARDVGHITQICVVGSHRGTGLGYELLRQSLMGLRHSGCSHATLTVTAANRQAVSLYERMGFSTIRKFRAFVWEGF